MFFHSMGSVLKISTTVSDISSGQIPCKGFATCSETTCYTFVASIHLHQGLITHFNSTANLLEVQDISIKQNLTADPSNTIKLGKTPHQGLVTTLRTFVWIECLIRALQVVPSAFITYL